MVVGPSNRNYEESPTGIIFDDRVEQWLERPEVRSFESDLFSRLCIGYSMMRKTMSLMKYYMSK